jgi:hypothetical protein
VAGAEDGLAADVAGADAVSGKRHAAPEVVICVAGSARAVAMKAAATAAARIRGTEWTFITSLSSNMGPAL